MPSWAGPRDSRLTQLQLKNGVALVQGQSYAYADGMNLTGISDQVTATNSNTLGYSPANRLNLAVGPWGTKTHSYDGVGNRITDNTTQGAATTNRTQYYAPTLNRLDNIWQNGALLQYYNHDAAGNMISLIRAGENFQYSYNKRNRLASVTRNSLLWGTYVYNALEQLVSRTSNAPSAPLGIIHYIYDLDGHLIAETDGATGATLREYLWLPANDNTSGSGNDTLAEAMGVATNDNDAVDLPLAVIDGVGTASPITSFIHTDHLGRPIRMTSATKATVWSATWTPWGEPQSISDTVTNNLRFPGQYFQIETGLAYNWHRHYDPATGRYIQPDPLGFVDGPSVYAYAGNSPFMNTDRDGRRVVKIIKKVWDASKQLWKDLNFDGPSPGLDYGNGRVCQVRYKKRPIFRMDYQPILGSRRESRLHFHAPPDMDNHYSFDPRSVGDYLK